MGCHCLLRCHLCHTATLYPILPSSTKCGLSHTFVSFHSTCVCLGHSTSFIVIRYRQLYWAAFHSTKFLEGAHLLSSACQSLTQSLLIQTEKLLIDLNKAADHENQGRRMEERPSVDKPPSPYLPGDSTPQASEKLNQSQQGGLSRHIWKSWLT